MAASSHLRAIRAGALLLALGSCSVGVGVGEVTGTVSVPQCDLEGEYSLHPEFYSASPFEGQLAIRIQNGGDFSIESDGIGIIVLDAVMEAGRLGTPIAVSSEPESPVTMSFYLNDSCPADRSTLPVYLEATEGTITFEKIYAPDIDEDQRETSGTFQGVVFGDDTGERTATLDGEFRFLFERGRPGQPFP